MQKSSKIPSNYKTAKKTMTVAEEAAVKYENMRVILGGNISARKSISGDFALIDLIRKGVKKSTLKSLASYLGITMETMSNLLHTSHRNIQRKGDDEYLDSLKSEKVLELAAFAHRGIDVIGSPDAFAQWLQSPLLSLGNKRPIDFLDTSFGIQMLTKILGRLEQGVFS
ncbi:MAG: DUF2384 domain-containing protein [Chitinophagaceae bacterium]|jgi:putative toxin-antitoxin system antitoxin component (TIGR02293 family)|nr:DUF2384 domain-containing protein [Chitinophagaceae bacterium]